MKGIYAHRYFCVLSKLFVLVALVVGTVILAPAALAQYGDPLTEYGFKPFGSFDNGENDSVNLVNLELNLHIPLGPIYPQRGKMFSAGFQVTYTANTVGAADPKSWDCSDFSQGNPCDNTVNPPPPSDDYTNTGGLNIQSDNLFADADRNDLWTSDGALHEFAYVPSLGAMALDASGYFVTSTYGVKNGYGVFNPGGGQNLVGYTDTNGTNTFTNGTNSITDTIGRPLPDLSTLPSPTALNNAFSNYPLNMWTGINPSGPGWTAAQPQDYANCTGAFPTSHAIMVNFPSVYNTPAQYEICYTNVYVSPEYVSMEDVSDGYTLQDGYYQRDQYVTPALVEIQSIVLPNHTAYTFTYAGSPTPADLPPPQPGLTGDLLKITLPTGGSISYTWDYPNYPPGTGVWNTVDPVRILTSRTVDANDGTGPHTWSYKLAPGPGDDQYVSGGPSDFP